MTVAPIKIKEFPNKFTPSKARDSVSITGIKALSGVYDAISVYDNALHKAEKNPLTKKEIETYSDFRLVIQSRQAVIEEHVERRVQLFFQQAILCYNTPFVYTAEGAEDQIGKGSSLKVSNTVTYKTQAAHSSTFPCLYATPLDNNGEEDPSNRVVYLRHSHAYTQHNATMELPTPVNQTDTYIDGKPKIDRQLRSRAIKILNETAQGMLSPTQATIEFMKQFIKVLKNAKEKLPEEDKKRYIVVKVYLPHAKKILKNIQNSSDIFDQIMGVNVHSLSNDEKVLRRIVYQKRYRLIQQAETIHSQIALRILQAQNAIFKTKKRSLKQIDPKLRYSLLKNATSEKMRLFLEKLFCTSIPQLESDISDPAKIQKQRTRMQKFREEHKKVIHNLERDLRAYHRSLVRLEFIYRSSLLRGFRVELKDWTQKALADAYKARFPKDPMSPSMVSRFEQRARLPRKKEYETPLNQRTKEIDLQEAKKMAAVYGVDVGLFLPLLLSS